MSVVLVVVVLMTGVMAAGLALTVSRQRLRTMRRRVFNDLLLPNVSDGRFAPRDVVLLPQPVSRYFSHSVPTDRPVARTVDLNFIGETRVGPDSEWLRLESRHRICPGRGFLWQARLDGVGPMTAEGAEFLSQGRAGGHYSLGGWWPLVRTWTEEFRPAAVERLLVDSFWLPSSLLPDRGIRWRSQDEHRATAVFPAELGGAAITISVDDRGALTDLSTVRWRRAPDGTAYKAPFAIRFEDEGRFDGYMLPCRAISIWEYGTDAQFEFLRLELETARFY